MKNKNSVLEEKNLVLQNIEEEISVIKIFVNEFLINLIANNCLYTYK